MSKNIKVILLVVTSVFILHSYNSHAGDKPVAYWDFDNCYGSVVQDMAGDHDGTIKHDARWDAGYVDQALSFDGLGSYVTIPDSDDLDLTDAGTISVWINMDDISDFDGIVHKGGKRVWSDEAYSLQFWTKNRIALGLVHNDSDYTLLVSKTRFETGKWYHVAATWDGRRMKLYVNGKLDARMRYSIPPRVTDGDIQIGAQLTEFYNNDYKNFPFAGRIDEVKIYNYALSKDEIAKEAETQEATLGCRLWSRFSSEKPDHSGNTMVAYNGGIAVDFGSKLQLWFYDGEGHWKRLSSENPEFICAYDGKLAGDFGSYWGLWEYDGSWKRLSSENPDNSGNAMVAYGNGLAVDFGSMGLWYYNNGAWKKLSSENPDYMLAYEGNLAVDFGEIGLWIYNGSSWKRISMEDADNTGNTMIPYKSGFIVDFGAKLGLWLYNGSSWKKLSSDNADYLAVYQDKIVANFGNGLGLREYDGNSWKLIEALVPDKDGKMVNYKDGLIVDFGATKKGIWYWNGKDWTRISYEDPEFLYVYNDKLVSDFVNIQLWEYDGSYLP